MKKWYISFIAVFVLITTWIVFTICNSPYVWSMRLQDAIAKHDTQRALVLIDEGIAKGYDMNTTNIRASFLTSMLEMSVYTPLDVACRARNPIVVERLLQEGANPNVGGMSRAPVLYVLTGGYCSDIIPVMELLLAYGADFTSDDPNDLPIVWAVGGLKAPRDKRATELSNEEILRGFTDVVLFLSQYNDVNTVTNGGFTLLHKAALCSNWMLREELAKNFNIPLSARDYQGHTAYDYAVKYGAPADILDRLKPED